MRGIIALAFLLLLANSARAHEVIVTNDTELRDAPNATSSTVIQSLGVGDEAKLIASLSSPD